jgi:hypothetical protein
MITQDTINKLNLTEQEVKDLKLIKNYFGTHDRTTFEHFAYAFLKQLIEKIKTNEVRN